MTMPASIGRSFHPGTVAHAESIMHHSRRKPFYRRGPRQTVMALVTLFPVPCPGSYW